MKTAYTMHLSNLDLLRHLKNNKIECMATAKRIGTKSRAEME